MFSSLRMDCIYICMILSNVSVFIVFERTYVRYACMYERRISRRGAQVVDVDLRQGTILPSESQVSDCLRVELSIVQMLTLNCVCVTLNFVST